VVFPLAADGGAADAVSEWADTATERHPMALIPSTMALIQNAVYEAVNAITGRYPADHVDPWADARRVDRCGNRRGEPGPYC